MESDCSCLNSGSMTSKSVRRLFLCKVNALYMRHISIPVVLMLFTS